MPGIAGITSDWSGFAAICRAAELWSPTSRHKRPRRRGNAPGPGAENQPCESGVGDGAQGCESLDVTMVELVTAIEDDSFASVDAAPAADRPAPGLQTPSSEAAPRLDA